MKYLSKKRFQISILPLALCIVIFAQGLVIAELYSRKDDKIYSVQITPIPKEKDSLDLASLKNDLYSIEESTRRIQQFLTSKDIKSSPLERLAKDSLSSTVYLSNITARYSEKLVELEKALQEVPLGVPSSGYLSSFYGVRKNPIPPKHTVLLASVGSVGPDSTATPKAKTVVTQFHKGIDLAAPIGTQVVSTAKGKVIFAGEKGGYGKCVIISHGNGLSTLYAHLSSYNVRAGEKVKVGQQIALSGNTGRSTGPHLHYEVHRNGTPVNPKLFLSL